MAHFIPFLVLVFVVITKAIAASRQNQVPPPRPRDTGPRPPRQAEQPDSEEERMRRFMEAVGLPGGGAGGAGGAVKPPPVVRPRPQAQLRPLPPIQPPGETSYPTPGRLRRARTDTPPVMRPAPAPIQRVAPVQQAPSVQPAMRSVEAAPRPISQKVPEAPPVAAVFSAYAQDATPAPEVYTSRGLLLDLRNPQTVRQAIVFREILGPPKAFQI